MIAAVPETPDRLQMRRIFLPLIVLLALPVTGLVLAERLLSAETAPGPASRVCSGLTNMAEACAPEALAGWLEALSLGALGLAALTLAAALALALFAGERADRLARIWPPLAAATGWIGTLLALLQAAILVFGGALLLDRLLGQPGAWAVGAGTAALAIAALGALAIALRAGRPRPRAVQAVPLPRERAPDLWELVDNAADHLGAPAPDRLVIGLAPEIWVAEGAVALRGSARGVIEGRVLHLSLPLLRLLQDAELLALLGRALASTGPGTARGTQGVRPLADPPLAALPAAALPALAAHIFEPSLRRLRRAQAAETDRAAAAMAPAEAFGIALLKLSLAERLGRELIEEQSHRIAEGRAPAGNLSIRLADAWQLTLSSARLRAEGPASMAARESHPDGPLPPTGERLAAAGVPMAALTEDALRAIPPQPLGDALMDDLEDREEALTETVILALYDRLGPGGAIAETPGATVQFHEALMSMLGPVIMHGPDPAERYLRAVAFAAEELPHLDTAELAGHCLGRIESLDFEDAVDRLAATVPPGGGTRLLRLVETVIGAPGEDEAALLEDLAHRFAEPARAGSAA